MTNYALLILTSVLLSGCASMTTGQTQAVKVDTGSDCGSKCTLKNDKGIWTAPSTATPVSISRSAEDLTVSCEHGEKSGSTTVKSSLDGMVFGNILMPGGLVATAIDCQNGSAYAYPETIKVAMK